MKKLENDALKDIQEPTKTFAMRNIMLNTIKRLTPSTLGKLDDMKLYELYTLANEILKREPEVYLKEE